MDQLTLWMALGFLFAGYSVIANDSVQTLGTWIASNNQKFKWTTMWYAASAVLLWALWYGWNVNGGDSAMVSCLRTSNIITINKNRCTS